MAGRYERRRPTFGIKISEIPDCIDEYTIRKMFARFGNITSIHVKDSLPLKHAYVNYDSLRDARRAAKQMNQKVVRGGTLKVKVQNDDYSGIAMSQSSRSFIHSAQSPDLFFRSLTHPVTSDLSLHSNVEPDVNQFSVKISNIHPNTTQVELTRLFKTTVILKRVPGNKSYAYANYNSQQEMEYALINHNVTINGLKIQVKIASSSKVKLLYILKMFPNLSSEILKDFGITIQGFQVGSTELTLSGDGRVFYEPYLKIVGILDRHNIMTASCFGLLIPSVQKWISLEKLPAVLCTQAESDSGFCYAETFSKSKNQISLSICGPGDVPQNISKILSSPEQMEVALFSTNVLQNLKASADCNFVQLLHHYGVYVFENVHGPSLVVQGYVKEDVMEVYSILSNSIERFVKSHPRSLPRMAHIEKFQYNCDLNFKPLIQEFVTEPLQRKLSVTVLFVDPDAVLSNSSAKRSRRKKSNSKPATLTITVQSDAVKDFSIACRTLKEMDPQLKYCTWPKKQYDFLSTKVNKELKNVELSNHVHIKFQDESNSVTIYGLNTMQVSKTEYYLRDCVESKLETESYIKVTRYESMFLKNKYKSSLDEFCNMSFPTSSDFQLDSAGLVLKGGKAKVEMAKQKICEAIDGLQVRTLKFRHDSYGEMWKRRWVEVKKQEEEAHSVVVNVYTIVDSKTAQTPADVVLTVELAVIGTDLDAVNKTESAIKTIGVELLRKTKTLEKSQLVAILGGLKSKKLRLREDYNTEALLDWDKFTIELITPNGSPEDLEAAYSTVMAYVEGVAINSEVITLNNSSLTIFLQHNKQHWQQIVTVAKQHSVIVKLIDNGIEVRGKLDDIDSAKKSIGDKLQECLKLFEEKKIIVDALLIPILDTPMFEGVIAKVRQDHGVILSDPKCKVVQRVQVKRPDDSLLTIEVCIGNILDEPSDAIVNIVNCNFQDSAGLAKEIVDAGGPTIQQEYDDHIKQHGAIRLCEAICLGSGALKCKNLIHVVPPLWGDGKHGESAGINKAISNSLLLVENHSGSTVSIPSFYDDPPALSECAKTSILVTLSLCSNGTLKSLKLVKFILPTTEIANEFQQELSELQSTIPGVIGSGDVSINQGFSWFWENDVGSLEPYSAKDSVSLSQQYSLNSKVGKLTIKGNAYMIDFVKMVQVNEQTLTSRRIEKRKLQTTWKYENDGGQWDLYTEQQSQAIETMWKSKTPSVLQIGKWEYTFNFDSTPMTQINVSTNRSRPINRIGCETIQHFNYKVDKSLLLVGPKQNLDKAEKEIGKFLESNLVVEDISLSAALPCDLMHDISKKYDVEVSSLTPSKVVLKGLSSNVMRATMEVKELLLRDYTKGEKTLYPVEWEPQNDEIELKLLSSGTPEWSKVSQQLHTTLSSAEIIKIERVQNKWLWEKYGQHSKRMKKKNGGVINEKMLFHGTRNNPPSSIYQDEEGFDMRFSNAGMWGTGNYFAVNASYSDGYAHLSDGTKQMFLAKVLTGDSIQLKSNSTLRMPPVKDSSKGVVRYDTVTGHTNGSQVFIAYSNDKAYPFYLISYR
ncbi:uncharacterized protein [Dysidea avara]|uniref:uncharacterized protein isoform X2 n=1 Tax=Dysidea avara TaxID=196820 RepID=UPI0033311C4E